jgi:subtilisin-like proprotein convertase family protein
MPRIHTGISRLARRLLPLLLLLLMATSAVSGAAAKKAPRHHLPDPQTLIRRETRAIQPLKGQKIKATGAYEREYWYWYERSRPTGVFPKGAELAARMRASNFRARARAARAVGTLSATASALLGNTWTELGPRGTVPEGYGPGIVSGRIMAILLQKERNRILIGSASGGIWKRSLTAGSLFEPKSDYASNLSVGALAADPSNPDTIYAGTGEPGVSVDSFDGAGLLKSVDGGETWSRIDGTTFNAKKITGVWVDPRDSQRLLVSTLFHGCWRSTNGGGAWTAFLNGSFMGFAVSPANPDRILFSNSDPFGFSGGDLVLSTNGGTTVTPLNGPWKGGAGSTVGRLDIGWSPTDPNVVWVSHAPPAFGAANGATGIFRSTNGGSTFTVAFSGNPHGSGWYYNPVAVSRFDPNTVWVGGVDLFRGTLGGSVGQVTHWFEGTGVPFIHADQHAIVIDPENYKTIYAGTDGGLYVSYDYGKTWSDMNAGLGTVQFYYGCVGANNGLVSLLGGTQDNGTERPLAGSGWTQPIGGDGFQCVVDPQQSNILYGTIQFCSYQMSTNFGQTFFDVTPPSNVFLAGEAKPFVTPLSIDPSDGTRLFTGAQRVYRGTSNRSSAVTWTALGTTALFGGEQIRRVAVAKTDGNVIYASGGGQLAKTATGNAPWTAVSPPGGQFITGLAVHPADANYVVCSRSGFSGGQVMRSLTGGTAWQSVTANLPNVPANNLVLRAVSGRLDCFLATDTGVYYADLNAATVNWSPVGAGLPNVVVHDVLLADDGRTVIAVTHGRGMWSVPTPAPFIHVEAPNGGEAWGVGSSQEIRWSSGGLTGDVMIEVSRDGGSSYTPVIASTPDSGSYTWAVNGTASANARIRITSLVSPLVSDMSDTAFTISGASTFSISGTVTSGGSGLAGVTVRAVPSVSQTSSPGTAIPDAPSTGIEAPIVVPQTGTVVGLRVAVNITHTWRGDLEISLVHPDGTAVRLKDVVAGDSADNVITSYPDLTPPAQSLSVLNGKPIDGTWKLRIRDFFQGDIGTLSSWTLDLTPSGTTKSATTASGGAYTIPGLVAGSYSVTPSLSGFRFTPPSRAVTIGPDQTGVDFTGAQVFTIRGRVTANGTGLVGTTVRAGTRSAVTAADGTYAITDLAPSRYRVTAAKAGFTITPSHRWVRVGPDQSGVDFAATQTFQISGTITLSGGAGVASVTVTAGSRATVTSSSGTYTIAGLAAGTYTVTPSRTGYTFTPALRVLTVGPNASGANFTATPTPAARPGATRLR